MRRLAAGERLNEAVDWPNLIEEIGDLGVAQLNACQSLRKQALVYLLKLAAEPVSQACGHWRGEVRGFLTNARQRFTPSMRRHLDIDAIFADAV